MLTPILLLILIGPTFDTNSLGLYKFPSVEIYKLSQNYLFCSGEENKLLLVSGDGQILNRYAKQGEGPDHLKNPKILGLDSETIYVCSNDRFILKFNKMLKFQGLAPSLPLDWNRKIMGFGESEKNGAFLVSARKNDDYFFHEIQLEKDLWKLTHSYVARQSGEEKFSVKRHGDLYFITSGVLYKQDRSYKVMAHKPPLTKGDESMVMAMSADVEGVDVFNTIIGIKGFVGEICRKPDGGFLVEWGTQAPHIPKNSRRFEPVYFWDHFSWQGELQKRESADHKQLVPVINSSEVFVVSARANGEQFLEPLF